jgi:hypothetical protein
LDIAQLSNSGKTKNTRNALPSSNLKSNNESSLTLRTLKKAVVDNGAIKATLQVSKLKESVTGHSIDVMRHGKTPPRIVKESHARCFDSNHFPKPQTKHAHFKECNSQTQIRELNLKRASTSDYGSVDSEEIERAASENTDSDIWEDESFARLTHHVEKMKLSCMDALESPDCVTQQQPNYSTLPPPTGDAVVRIGLVHGIVNQAVGKLNQALMMLSQRTGSATVTRCYECSNSKYRELSILHADLEKRLSLVMEENKFLKRKVDFLKVKSTELERDDTVQRELTNLLMESFAY